MIARFTVCFLFLVLIGCSPKAAPPNQKQGAVSPSGNYILNVPIEPQTTNPQYKGTPVWKITIADASGAVLYKDEDSTMVGNLNVYWGWDAKDRAWAYNSDDGRIWRWELAADGWKKNKAEKSDGMPEFVLPGYEKKR